MAMRRRITVLAGTAGILATYALTQVTIGGATAPPGRLAIATVHFEQNVTDGDAETVFEIKGGADGLSGLTVVGPDGRTVISFEAPDATTLGVRQFRLESPEPKDIASLKSAYPEGEYTFAGWTAEGDTLGGESTLSHQLPPPVAFLHPKAGATGVPADRLEITWTAVKDAAAYIVKIEQDELGETITARIPASAPRFPVPAGFLRPGTEYQLGIGAVSTTRNISFVEMTFTTARTTAGK
jgi:hypothetical protein